MHDAVRGAGNRFDPVCCSSLQYVPLYGTLWGMAVVSDQADPLLLTAAAVDFGPENAFARNQFFGVVVQRQRE